MVSEIIQNFVLKCAVIMNTKSLWIICDHIKIGKKSVIDKMKHYHVNKGKPVIARILNIENLEYTKLINESASNDYILYF